LDAGDRPRGFARENGRRGHATISFAPFCAQARDGRIVANAVPESSALVSESAGFDVAAMNGAKVLIDEACP
jgi:hypothetical protein